MEAKARIYSRYVTARNERIVPERLEGLASRAPYLKRLIRRWFPTDRAASILELGCGHGALIHFAGELGYHNIRGVDASGEQIAEAERLGVPGVAQGDLLETLSACKTDSTDLVIAFDVIEHFRKDELLELADNVFRVLKPGGRWIIHAPNAESPFGARIRYGDFTHELAFTRASVGQLLLSSGFAKVECFEDEPVPHGLKSAIRWILWKLFRKLAVFWLVVETGVIRDNYILSQNLLAVAEKGR